MSQQVYVWQRNWTASVKAAIRGNSEIVDGITVLCAEISIAGGVPNRINVSPDWEVLRSINRPVTLAIRVGNYAGPFESDAPLTKALLNEVEETLNAARTAGLEPAGIEIDFDCATRHLEGYARWLRLIRVRLGSVPLSVTTLPTWMGRAKAFGELVGEADRFVLQVHSIQRADHINSPAMLCDPILAKRWAERAADFGKFYHVALPTYAYRLGYDRAGELVEVAGENASPQQNPYWRYRVIRADPEAMITLVRSFEQKRPQNCLGVIWYRLPIDEERYNWDAQTWRAVMAGLQLERDAWQAKVRPDGSGVLEIKLTQNSQMGSEPPKEVLVSWGGGTAIAWDGQRNYSVGNADPSKQMLVWKWPDNMPPPLLAPGTQWTIGWLRIDAPVNLNISIINHEE